MSTPTSTTPTPRSSGGIEYRSFTPELQVRAAAAGGDGRTVVGIAVPYGVPMQIDEDLREQFAYGCASAQFAAAHRVPFARDHLPWGGILLGRTIELRDDAAGLWGAWRVSRTVAGDETLALIEDGALSQLSVGFRERQNRWLPDGTVERVTIDLREVAVCLRGAYGDDAAVQGLRSQRDGEHSRLARSRQVLAGIRPLPLS